MYQTGVFRDLAQGDKQLEKIVNQYSAKILQYEADLRQLQHQIALLDKEIATREDHSRWYLIGETLFEVAIVACAFAIYVGRPAYWWIALLCACSSSIVTLQSFR